MLVHSLRIVHIIEVGHRLYGEEHALAVGIDGSSGNLRQQTEGLTLQAGIVVSHLAPLTGSEVIGTGIQHLRSDTCHILAVAVVHGSHLTCQALGGSPAEYRTEEALGMLRHILLGIFFRVPCHVHKQLDGIFHGFQVTDIQNPHTLDAVVVSQRQLFEHLLCLGDVQPLRITGSTDIVDMVVQAPATGVLTLLGIGDAAHITPVVVAQQHDDIVGHTHAGIIVVEHLFIQGPHLRGLVGGFTGHLLDNLTLVLHNALQQFGVGIGTHRFVAIATHTDGHHVLGTLHALNTLAEELVQLLLVLLVVPGAPLATLTGILLMVAGHRLMV